MKKIFPIIITFIIFFFTISISNSNEKIVFIDFEYIINNSDRGKLIFKNLNDKRNNNIEILKLDEKKLKDEENDIKLKKEIISKDELKKKILSLNDNVKKYQNKKKTMEDELNKIKNKEMNNFMSQINSLLENYMKEQSADIMLNSKNILIGKKTINKTKDILELVNEKIK
jgi:Skp family chaperone for outer membrane proteins